MTGDLLDRSGHRPWPLPDRPWSYAQRWDDLLFVHRPIRPALLRPLVPPRLRLDTFDGSAWVGVVPFRLSGLRPRMLPALPGISRFPELNVRTYVTAEGKPGVYFFSLDAGSALAVLGARIVFRLPYFRAAMHVRREGDVVAYRSRRRGGPLGVGSRAPGLRRGRGADSPAHARFRTHDGEGVAVGGRTDGARPPAVFVARYRPTGPAGVAEPGSIERFLTERYCLYTVDGRGRALRVEIHHPPWRLRPAEVEFEVDSMAAAAGIVLPDVPPLLHFAEPQNVIGWLPEAVGPAPAGPAVGPGAIGPTRDES